MLQLQCRRHAIRPSGAGTAERSGQIHWIRQRGWATLVVFALLEALGAVTLNVQKFVKGRLLVANFLRGFKDLPRRPLSTLLRIPAD